MTQDTTIPKETNLNSSLLYDNMNEENDVSVGINNLIKASKKLLDVNKGLVDPDERDSLVYKKIYNTDDLIEERIALDAGKLKTQLMYKLSKTRNLKNFPSGYFDPYALGHIIGNSLSSPSEEINPLQLFAQLKAVTAMGQGGIGSLDAITKEAQDVHPSQFGFICAISSPESGKAGVDVKLASNTRLGINGIPYTRVVDKKTGKKVWLTPKEIQNSIIGFSE